MITKDQAMTESYFIQTHSLCGKYKLKYGTISPIFIANGEIQELSKPIKWRVNGKCKTWKTRPDEFKLPIKHGLYDNGYLTHKNAHLFTLDKE